MESLRSRVPWLPLPVFTFRVWLGGLLVLVVVLAALTPVIRRGGAAGRVLAWALAATLVLIAGAQLSAQDLRPIGGFDNVRASDATGESHCYGYSVELWQFGSRVIGLLDVHGGLCGDPPCAVLRDAAFDRRTGHLTFRSVVRTIAYDFVGELSSRRISGTLNGKPVRLRRGADDPMNVDPRPQTLAGWCRFWMSVPRCEGVSELCESLGQRP